jgi:Protein of unknown function with HXXEE motif
VARLSISGWYALLIAAQAAHSAEEYATRLYDRFAPARFVSDALGLDRPLGFAIANLSLLGFGLWCWRSRIGPRRGAWRGLTWFWAIVESANGTAHLLLALAAGGYFPGLVTAPVLLALGLVLIARLRARAS